MKLIKTLFFTGLIIIVYVGGAFAQGTGSIAGTVTDAAGAVIPGATVTAVDAGGKQKQIVANARGEYTITGLAAGKYTLKAIAKDFGLYQNTEVVVSAGQKSEQLITLIISEIKETVDVDNSKMVSTDPDNNKDATVLSGKDLDALPDDPDELQAALQALVGASAGPNGGQIYIDGFTGGQLPNKDQIREIRINQNPFSAEFDRPGNGRIEILTKPGTDKFRGSVNGAFNDESLNSRNPFALNRAPTQLRRFGGNLSGPIQKGKSSFNLEVNQNNSDNSTLINAQILDPSFAITTFRQDVRQPTKRFSLSPRFDFAVGKKNTVVARYSFTSTASKNQGVGDTTLLSRASASTSKEHEVRITESMIINPKTVNETRFEFSDSRRNTTGDNSIPAISVISAFTSGGAQVGNSFNNNQTIDINNFTSTSFGKRLQHSVKFGGRFRHVKIDDRSENGYAGTFVFQGLPLLPAGTTDQCDIDNDNVVTSIEQYRCKVLGIGGNRYNPQQFTITSGNPQQSVSQTEGALYVLDDWKVRPDFQLGIGLRYENQTNIKSPLNFAPRLSLAWSPGAGGAKGPHFVLRAGAGIFYDRFGENNTLQALRFNGINQLSLRVNFQDSDAARRVIALGLLAQPVFTLSGVTNVPTAAQIQAVLPASSTIRQVSPVLQSPYTIQSVFSFEKTLSPKLTLTANFQMARTLHQIRTRNINAPICPNFYTTSCTGAPRPLPAFTDINEYESSGYSNRLGGGVFVNARLTQKVSFFANYSIQSVKSNSDTPVYAYDLTGEYAPAAGFVPRHNVNLFGTFTLPWGVTLNPIIGYRTGTRFNITTGGDLNLDGSLNERPTFAQLANACIKNNVTGSFCNVSGFDPNAIIPKNLGVGPSSFTTSLRIGRTFSFGKEIGATADNGRGGGNRGGGGRGPGGPQMVMMGGGGGERGGGMMGGFGGGNSRRPYNLNLSVQITNPLNKVNFANPVGNITSFRFGQSVATAGTFGGFGGFGGGTTAANRRVELQARFSW